VSFFEWVIVLVLTGLLVGGMARLALPGKDPLTIPQTIGVGLAGSFLAGIVVQILSGGREGAGFLASLVFSVLILYFIRRHRGGGLTSPGEPPPPR
jgi:uncharacterized membrane protein YeaQ/YmgE (transglycosylase-associated protein family)